MSPVSPSAGEDEDPEEAGYGLIQEVSSIIDYTQYRERGATISHLLLGGPDKAVRRLRDSLEEYLGIPVLSARENINVAYKPNKKRPITNHLAYLDALGASLPTPDSAPDLDLRYKKPDRKIFRRIVAPIIVSAAILGMLAAAGIWVPRMRLEALREESGRLDQEFARYASAERGNTAALRGEVEFMEALEGQSAAFRAEVPASETLAAVYGALPADVSFSSVEISEGAVSMTCVAPTLEAAAMYLERLRAHGMFSQVSGGTVDARYEEGVFSVDFDISLTISGNWGAAQ
jgi:hypothetical protein